MKPYQIKEVLEKDFKELKYNTEIGKKYGVSDDTIEYWRKKFTIPKEPYLSISRKHFFNERYFEKIDTEEKAYWLGFLMADGCVCTSAKNSNINNVRITLQIIDKEHIELFNKAIESDYPIKEKILYDKRGFSSQSASIKINSRQMCIDLEKYGIVANKTGKEIIPEIDKELVRHFIRGYFDGDGSITIQKTNNAPSFKICSASIKLIQNIISIFSELGIKINYQTYNNNFYILETRKQANIIKIKNYLYKDSTVYLKRKFNKISQICANFKKAS